MSTVNNDPFQEIQRWNAQGMNISAEVKKLMGLIDQIQSALSNLGTMRDNLQQALDSLKKELSNTDDPKRKGEIETQINQITQQIGDCTTKIASTKNTLASEQGQLLLKQGGLNSFLSDNSLQTAQSALKSGKKQQIEVDEVLTTGVLPISREQRNQEAMEAVNKYVAATLALSDTIAQYIEQIKNARQGIIADKAKLEELKNKIIENSIAAAACLVGVWWTFGLALVGVAYFTAQAIIAAVDLGKAKDNISALETQIAKCTTALKAAMQELQQMNADELGEEINKLLELVQKVLALFSNGNVSEKDLQNVAAAVVEILAALQLITSKVHAKRAEDQQEMSKASQTNFEMATNKSIVDLQQLAEATRFQNFMKITMIVVQVVMAVAAVALAIATGGTASILIALAMAALTAYTLISGKDPLGELTQLIADQIDKTKSAWSKVLADVIVAVTIVLLVVLTEGAAVRLAAGRAGAQAARLAAQEIGANAIEMAPLRAAQQLGNGAAAPVNNVARGATATAADIAKRGAFVGVASFAMSNGLIDLSQTFAEIVKSKKDLKDDEVFQIVQIIMGIIQAIMLVFAQAKAFSGSEGVKSALEKVLGKLGLKFDLDSLIKVMIGAQVLGNGIGAGAHGGMALNQWKQGDITGELGESSAQMLVYKNILDTMRSFEEHSSQAYIVLLQQWAESMQQLIRKVSAPEMEAARLLTETAV